MMMMMMMNKKGAKKEKKFKQNALFVHNQALICVQAMKTFSLCTNRVSHTHTQLNVGFCRRLVFILARN